MGLFSFLTKKKEQKEDLDKGLEKTKTSVFSRISHAIVGKSKVDDEVLDELEEILITSDVGVETTLKIIERIEKRVARDKYVGTDELNTILKEEIMALLQENQSGDGTTFDIEGKKPYVIMVVGVNGVGKTTTIGKLAHNFKKAGKKVVLGASDWINRRRGRCGWCRWSGQAASGSDLAASRAACPRSASPADGRYVIKHHQQGGALR